MTETEMLLAYQRHRTRELRDALLLQYLPGLQSLARRAARRFTNALFEEEHYVSVGVDALLACFANYNPALNKRFWPYAMRRIHGAFQDELRTWRGARRKNGVFVGKCAAETTLFTGHWNGNQAPMAEFVGAGENPACTAIDSADYFARLASLCGCARSAEILRMYYVEDKSMKQIGKKLKLSEARVCQILKEAILRLRQSPTLRALVAA